MLSFLLFEVGKSIEREVVVEVLFKPEVYVAEVENNDNKDNEHHGQLCAGGDELPHRGCGGAGLLREGETHP